MLVSAKPEDLQDSWLVVSILWEMGSGENGEREGRIEPMKGTGMAATSAAES